jgi:putative resolvase
MSEYVSIKEASRLTGLHENTLRRLGDEQKISCYKTPSGQRRFNKYCLEKMCNPIFINKKSVKTNFIYARVSSKKQLDDLSRQITYIQSSDRKYISYTTLSDIGSGVNFKRKGLQTLLDACLQQIIGEVVIAHRDRLSRFGFELIKCIIEKAGGTIKVLGDDIHKSTEQELAEDLLSIVHIYSCKQMGKRKYTKTNQIKKSENTNLSNIISNENS